MTIEQYAPSINGGYFSSILLSIQTNIFRAKSRTILLKLPEKLSPHIHAHPMTRREGRKSIFHAQFITCNICCRKIFNVQTYFLQVNRSFIKILWSAPQFTHRSERELHYINTKFLCTDVQCTHCSVLPVSLTLTEDLYSKCLHGVYCFVSFPLYRNCHPCSFSI